MNQETIIKYISGNSTIEEAEEVLLWRGESDENKIEFNRLKNAWSLSSYQRRLENSVCDKSYKKIKGRVSVKSRLLGMSVFRYASVIVIALISGVFINKSYLSKSVEIAKSYNTIRVPFGQTSSVVLADGSIVWLNSGSELTYNGNIEKGEQRVKLSGEGFFNISKNKKRKFIVETNSIDMHVYGTAFNVEAYRSSDFVRTTLVEGSVGICNKMGKLRLKLQPGKTVEYSKSSKILNLRNVDTTMYTSWKKGLVTFRDETLFEISKKLERWYNVKIIFEDKELKKVLYSGTILKYKPIDQILEVLKLTADIEYKLKVRAEEQSIIFLSQKRL